VGCPARRGRPRADAGHLDVLAGPIGDIPAPRAPPREVAAVGL